MSSQNDSICFCTKHFQYGSPGQRIRLPRFLFEKRDFQRRGAKTRRYAEISSESFSTFIRYSHNRRLRDDLPISFSCVSMPTLRHSATLRLCVKTSMLLVFQRRDAKTRRCAELSSESFPTFIRYSRNRRLRNDFTYSFSCVSMPTLRHSATLRLCVKTSTPRIS